MRKSPEWKKVLGISEREQDGWKFVKTYRSVKSMFRSFKRKAKQIEWKRIAKEYSE